MNIKRYKAFTIIELIITMIISSIIISIAYYSLLIFSNQFGKYKKRTERLGDFFQFKSAITRDFEDANHVVVSVEGLLLSGSETNEGISYYFNDSYIVRHAKLQLDTFYFDNGVSDLQLLDEHTPLVKNIGINIKLGGRLVVVILTKRYSYSQIEKFQQIQNE